MADNVIRRDLIEIGFDIDDSITKLNKEINDLKKALVGDLGDDAFDDLTKDAKKAKEGIEDVEKEVKDAKKSLKEIAGVGFTKLLNGLKNVGTKLTDISKKAGNAAFNGLKKLAGISFKALTVGLGAAATGIGAIVTQSIQGYAEFEQLKGGVETLFGAGGLTLEEYAKSVGKSTDEVKSKYESLKSAESEVFKNSNKAYKDAGLSANAYMQTVTSFSASLISSVGGDTKKAADLAHTAIVDMSDNANKMGTDMGSIQYAYQGFAKQNYTMLDNLKLGYGGTKTEMERLVKDAAKMTDIQKKLGVTVDAGSMSYGNIVKAIHIVQANMGILGTTEKEATGTITGSLNMVKATWGNLLTAIGSGENLDQCFDNMINAVEIFGDNVLPVAERALGGIGTVIEKLTPKLAEKLPELTDKLLPPLIKAATSLLAGLIKALPNIVKTFAKEIPNIIKEIGKAIADTFGKEFPALKVFGEGLMNNAQSIAKAVPYLLGAFAGFKLLKGVLPFVMGLFSKGDETGGGKGKGKNNFLANIGKQFAGLGKVKPSGIAKGMANLGIIVGGITLLTVAVVAIMKLTSKMAEPTEMLLLVGVVGAVGLVGAALAKLAGIVGKIPVSTVALGLANIAIIMAGMSALFLLIGAVSLLNFDYKEMLQIVGIIAVLGSVGAALAVFAGIVGLIPVPVVLAGLANMALVIGGVTALIVAFGKLSEIKGFNDFITNGGEALSNVFGVIGKCAGSLIGNIGESISESLPAIGENIGKFGKNVKPLFNAIKGIDMGGVGAFFTALIGLLGVATGKDIIDGIKSFFGGGEGESPLAKLGTELSDFAIKSKGFFTTIKGIPAESFPKATELFTSLSKIKGLPKANKDGTTSISAIANDLSTFNNKAGGFFTAVKDYDLEKVNQLWESLKSADDVTKGVSTKVSDEIDNIVKKVSDLPNKMGEGLKASGESLSTALVQIWKDAVTATAKPVNKLISGANYILKEFGSEKSIVEWKPYANGTDGHRGGNALVNDGRGAELVQMPNGNAFIPQGRDVFIPNAPKGMKVLSAEDTAHLLGKKSPTFRYADGNIDIWDYIDNSKGLVSAVSNKYVNYKGMKGIALHAGKGIVSTASEAMVTWADNLFKEMGALSLEAYNPSKGVDQWRTTVMRALRMLGLYSESNVKRTLYQMQTESGGNPRAINLWDSNAKKGIPSKGLMQVIDPTFKAYAMAGFDKNIYDPLSNILASMRYAVARYGSLEKAYRGTGYENGGIATRPSICGENYKPEAVIPLSPSKRKRAISLWGKTGDMLGLPTYTPEGGSYSQSNNVENNNYSPVFNLTINGSSDERATERKVKRWVNDAINETFASMARKKPRLREV